MTRLIGLVIFSAVLSILLVHSASAATVDLFGVAHHRDGSSAVGYEVYIYSDSTQWIGPSITDSLGRFAFFGIQSGRYLVSFSLNGREVWRGGAIASGRSVVITLP